MNVQNFVSALQSTPPFGDVWHLINIYRVNILSIENGADDPTNCTGGTGATARTYFDGSFCNHNIRRALMVNNTTAIAVANQQVPEWDMILVLVNSTIHGGTGGTVAVFSLTGTFNEIIIHEMGHTFFNLADEYEYLQGCNS
jgi:hypothetical protein